MESVKDLQRFILGLGWFSKTIKLTITIEREFEGFYNKASEDWENRITIEIASPDEKICPNIKVVGERNSTMDDVARYALRRIEHWKNKE